MSRWKFVFVMSSLMVIGLVTGCGGSNVTNGSESEMEVTKNKEEKSSFHASIETLEENNGTVIQYKVKNISGAEQKLTFPSSLQADYILYDENGNKQKQLSDETMATQAIQEMILANGEELSYEFLIEGLSNGNYVVEAFLTASEEQAKIAMDVIIERD